MKKKRNTVIRRKKQSNSGKNGMVGSSVAVMVPKRTQTNIRKQIHNLEEEYNSCLRKSTKIVIFEA